MIELDTKQKKKIIPDLGTALDISGSRKKYKLEAMEYKLKQIKNRKVVKF